MLKFFKKLPNDTRPETVDAIETIVEQYSAGYLGCSVNVPPRWGKSTIIRGSALELQEFGVPSIVLVPWEFLANQIKDKTDIMTMYERYQLPSTARFEVHRCKKLIHHKWFQLSNGTIPTILSMTLGLATNQSNRGQFLSGIDFLHSECSKLIPIFIDECQVVRVAKDKSWGPFALEIQNAGGFLVCTTGTPVLGIPGFKEVSEEFCEITRTLFRRQKVGDEIKTYAEKYNHKLSKVKQTSDVYVGWETAFSRGALAKAAPVWVDFDVYNETEPDEIIGKLSSLDDLTGFQLKQILEGEEATAKMAAFGVSRFIQRRDEKPKTQMMVITGYDKAERDQKNYHARAYKKAIINAIRSEGRDERNFRIEIATGTDNEGNPDENSTNKITEFREGKIDIIIVKMMGIVGLDCPEHKILVYAGIIRKGPMGAQALSRPLTQNGTAALLILPRDKKMVELYNSIIKDQGGEFVVTESELLDIEEVETIDNPSPSYNAKNGRVHGYSDQTGDEIEGDYELILRLIKKKYIVSGFTDIEILKNYERGAFPVDREREESTQPPQRPNIRDLDEDLKQVEGKFGRKAADIVNKYIQYKTHPKLWVEKIKELTTSAKKKCGVYLDVNDIDDAELLKKLIAALDVIEIEVFRRRKNDD